MRWRMATGVRARGCSLRDACAPRASPARLAPSQRHQVWPRDARQPHRVHPRVAAAHREVGVQRARARAGNTRGEAHARAEEAGGVGGRGLGGGGAPGPETMQARPKLFARVKTRRIAGDAPPRLLRRAAKLDAKTPLQDQPPCSPASSPAPLALLSPSTPRARLSLHQPAACLLAQWRPPAAASPPPQRLPPT